MKMYKFKKVYNQNNEATNCDLKEVTVVKCRKESMGVNLQNVQ